jgi:hypothetical protein
MLENIVETYQIRREDSKVVALADKHSEELCELDENAHVSMNMWACPARFIDKLEDKFEAFLEAHGEEQGAEYLLPSVINEMLHSGEADCRMYETTDKWFGVTNAVDKAAAQQAVREQIEKGIYPEKLWG